MSALEVPYTRARKAAGNVRRKRLRRRRRPAATLRRKTGRHTFAFMQIGKNIFNAAHATYARLC